jgi:hypothetical protein
MTGTTILAIDLGKYKCVSCTYDRVTAAAEFRAITTSRAEVERLVRAARPAVAVIEACIPAGWVHDLCRELGVPVKVANAAAEAWKYKHTRRKTDRDDALRLAQLEAVGQIKPVVVPVKRVAEPKAQQPPGIVPRPEHAVPLKSEIEPAVCCNVGFGRLHLPEQLSRPEPDARHPGGFQRGPDRAADVATPVSGRCVHPKYVHFPDCGVGRDHRLGRGWRHLFGQREVG